MMIVFYWKLVDNPYIYGILYLFVQMKKPFVLIKSGFTLIEMIIVLMIIGILMTATMRFWSGRIVDLKAQSLKEQFIGYYNDIYSQNMTSSFRDEKKYQHLTITFNSGMRYQVDQGPFIVESQLSPIVFRGFILDNQQARSAQVTFTPYKLWCSLAFDWHTGDFLVFQAYVPENGKQYCFEIKSETCKLVETKCN